MTLQFHQLENLEPRRLLSGITLITHGYQSSGTFPQWVDRMAEAVDRRIEPHAGALWTDAAHYRLQINSAGTGVASFARVAGPAPNISSTGEAVISLDWAAASNSLSGNPPANIVAQTVATALLGAGSSLGFPSTSGALAFPVHVIGHSRGAVLVAELARVLGQSGIVVDQVTTLDPFPLGADPGPSRSVNLGDNVNFADNYYQTSDFIVFGGPVSGAQNTGPMSLPGGASLAHSDVHTYYHGTIQRASTGDGDASINTAWYGNNLTRATTAFDWSRISGGARPAAGVSTIGGGSAARVAVTTGPLNTLWPNVVFSSITGGTNGFVANGQQLTFNYRHQTRNNSTEIDFFLDGDTNLFNGWDRVLPIAPVLPQSGATPNTLAGNLSFAWNTLTTQPGAYYVHALITDGAGKVRVHTFTHQLFVTSAGVEITTKRWADDTASHDWLEPRSWSPGGAPGAGDRASVHFGTSTINSTTPVGSIDVSGAAIVTSNATQRPASLALANSARFILSTGGNRLLVTGALQIAPSATLDLNDNALIVDYTGASPAGGVQSLINSARAGGAWTGAGLASSTAKNATPQNRTLGLLESLDYKSITGGTTFENEPIDDSAVLVKFTYYGDTDFNELVNFDDYARIDAGFLNNRTGWLNGDFNGDNVVNFDDYALIDSAFLTQGAPRFHRGLRGGAGQAPRALI